MLRTSYMRMNWKQYHPGNIIVTWATHSSPACLPFSPSESWVGRKLDLMKDFVAQSDFLCVISCQIVKLKRQLFVFSLCLFVTLNRLNNCSHFWSYFQSHTLHLLCCSKGPFSLQRRKRNTGKTMFSVFLVVHLPGTLDLWKLSLTFLVGLVSLFPQNLFYEKHEFAVILILVAFICNSMKMFHLLVKSFVKWNKLEIINHSPFTSLNCSELSCK